MLSTGLLSHRVRGIYRMTRGFCNRDKIGNRDVVGYGLNGTYMYMDLEICPFPAIRFRENTPDLLVNIFLLILRWYIFNIQCSRASVGVSANDIFYP